MKITIRKNKDITVAAKKVFGGIVDTCYVSKGGFETETEELINRKLNNVSIDLSAKGRIGYDAETIYILFNNGRFVEFSNSEWGSIEIADINKFNKID